MVGIVPGVALGWVLASATVAQGQQVPSDAAVGAAAGASAGTCPEREATLSALRKLGRRDQPEEMTEAAVRAGLATQDLGDRFRVTVGRRSREYEDAERDCARRARLAAVFCALVLSPDDGTGRAAEAAGGDDQPAKEIAAPAPSVAPVRPLPITVSPAGPPPAPRWILAAAPMVAVAPHGGSTLASAGLALGAFGSFGHTTLGLAVDVPLWPAHLTVGGAAVRLTRIPVRLLVGRAWRWGRVGAGVDVGAVGAVVRVARTGPAPTTSATRVEGGAHLGARAVWEMGRLGLYASLSSDWIPRTYPIALDPEGTLDRTPGLWLVGEAGLRVSFH